MKMDMPFNVTSGIHMPAGYSRFLLPVLSVIVACAGVNVMADESVDGRYRVGERVECDPLSGSDFRPGTVVAVEGAGSALTCCRYRVKIDNDDPLWSDGRLCFDRFIRRPGEAATITPPSSPQQAPSSAPAHPAPATPPVAAEKPAATVDFNALAGRPLLHCPVVQSAVEADADPEAGLLTALIRCLYERPAPAGMSGATTVDITDLRIGDSRPWRPREDVGSGNPDTVVYPVRATWIMKKHYETFTRVEENVSVFNCYVSSFGEWECLLGQRIRDGEARQEAR
jgi:hypothetical protein